MSNADKLRQAYQVWHDTRGANGSVWLDLFADDVVLRSLADGASGMKFSAPRTGKAAAEHYLAELAREWEMEYFKTDDFIADGDRVAVVGRCAWRYRDTGKTAESPVVTIWRFRDGKVVEFMEFYDTAKAFAAARPG